MRRYVALALTAFAVGCRPPAPPPAPRPGPSPVTREIVLDDGFITVRLDIPSGLPFPRPAVVSLLGPRNWLLALGLVVVSYRIDWQRTTGPTLAPGAENNPVGTWVLASPSPKVLGWRYLRNIVTEATTVVPRVLDVLAHTPEVDAARVGIVGVSTTGFIALQAAAADRRIGAVVVLDACGDYRRFLRYSSMGLGGGPLPLSREYRVWLRRREPIAHPERLTHAAIALVNRLGDPLIPVACAQETARVLRSAYARARVSPEHLRFVLVRTGGHGMGEVERAETQDWFATWLLARAPRARAVHAAP